MGVGESIPYQCQLKQEKIMQQELFEKPMRFTKKEYWEKFRITQTEFSSQSSNPAFCEQMNALAKKYMEEMTAIALEKYRKQIITAKIEMKMDWSRGRKTSRGGMKNKKGWMSINMSRSTVPFPVIEYARINNDPVIGYINSWSSEVHLACTVAHELAHVFQYLIRAKIYKKAATTKFEREYHRPGHGENWQSIYRLLRREYVNPMLGGQS